MGRKSSAQRLKTGQILPLLLSLSAGTEGLHVHAGQIPNPFVFKAQVTKEVLKLQFLYTFHLLPSTPNVQRSFDALKSSICFHLFPEKTS